MEEIIKEKNTTQDFDKLFMAKNLSNIFKIPEEQIDKWIQSHDVINKRLQSPVSEEDFKRILRIFFVEHFPNKFLRCFLYWYHMPRRQMLFDVFIYTKFHVSSVLFPDCCNASVDDEIIGIETNDECVEIHKKSCSKIQEGFRKNAFNVLFVKWMK